MNADLKKKKKKKEKSGQIAISLSLSLSSLTLNLSIKATHTHNHTNTHTKSSLHTWSTSLNPSSSPLPLSIHTHTLKSPQTVSRANRGGALVLMAIAWAASTSSALESINTLNLPSFKTSMWTNSSVGINQCAPQSETFICFHYFRRRRFKGKEM